MNSLSNQPSISVFVERMRPNVRVEGWPRRQAQGVAVGATGIVTPFGIPRSFFLTIRHVVTLYLTGRRGPLGRRLWSTRVLPPYHTSHYTPLLWTAAFDSIPRLNPRADPQEALRPPLLAVLVCTPILPALR